MKKRLFILIIIASCITSSCVHKKTLQDFCGQEVYNTAHSDDWRENYLYFKEKDKADLVEIEINIAEAYLYRRGDTVDCGNS